MMNYYYEYVLGTPDGAKMYNNTNTVNNSYDEITIDKYYINFLRDNDEEWSIHLPRVATTEEVERDKEFLKKVNMIHTNIYSVNNVTSERLLIDTNVVRAEFKEVYVKLSNTFDKEINHVKYTTPYVTGVYKITKGENN